MKELANGLYGMLSELNREYLKNGELSAYSSNLRKMATILNNEGNHKDELKHLMIAFYIDVSGWNGKSQIDWEMVTDIIIAYSRIGCSADELKTLFMGIVKSDIVPIGILDPEEGFEVLSKCCLKMLDFNKTSNER